MITTGVVVGRFQVAELHAGHLALLGEADKNMYLIVVLGHSGNYSEREPLDYYTRAMMVRERCPTALCAPLLDVPGDDVQWSHNLDQIIGNFVWPREDNIKLYGGVGSFIPHYRGKYPTHTVDAVPGVSGTLQRKAIMGNPLPSKDFRKGVIYGSQFKQNS